MLRYYLIEWHENRLFGKPINRTCKIELSEPTGDTAKDAHHALDLFIQGFGNLKKNTVTKIQEFGPEGQIGEDIVPQDNTSIVPTGR